MVKLIESVFIDKFETVYDWYYKEYGLKLKMDESLTFDDVIRALWYDNNIYKAVGIRSKMVCSNIMHKIADILGISYDDAMCYFIWKDAPDAFIPSNVNYQQYVDRFNRTMQYVLDNYVAN